MVVGHYRHEGMAPQTHGMHASMSVNVGQDSNVGLPIEQLATHRLRVAHSDRQSDVGIGREEAGEQAHDNVRAIRCYAQMALFELMRSSQHITRVFFQCREALRYGKEACTRFRQIHVSPIAMQEFDPVMLLERLPT